MEQRIAWVFPILHLIAQHLQHGWQDVAMVRQPLDLFTAFEPARGVDQEGHLEALLPDDIVMLVTAMLSEALAMVSIQDEDSIVVEPKLLVLIKEVLHEKVLVANAVEVTVDQVILREVLVPVTET